VIDTSLSAFPKPVEIEHRVTLNARQKKEQLDRKCAEQEDLCFYCGIYMTRLPFHLRTATRDHVKPQPRGCSKQDHDSNIVACCMRCNSEKGSRRDY
jgi:5-methylcytosine-specific restriction endonuclease McrA